MLMLWLILCRLKVDGYIKGIDLCRLELSSRNATLEQEIKLGKSTSRRLSSSANAPRQGEQKAHLRHAEIGVNDTQETARTPEETGKLSPIPCSRVDHVGGKDGADNVDDDVCTSTESDSLGGETTGGDLSDKGVGKSSDRDLNELVVACRQSHEYLPGRRLPRPT
jgi:hypothetical protein